MDGIRMDAVASMLYLDYGRQDGEWIPNMYGGNENLEAIEMIKHLNSILKKRDPGVLSIAEESTAFPLITGSLEEGGLGFDLKWNMGFMNDYLDYIKYDPYFRSHHHGELTFSMIYAYSEKFMLVFSHDEVVHGKGTLLGKMPGDRAQKLANLRLTYGYMMTHPGKKLLFMGQDLAEEKEWNEMRQVEWALEEQKENAGVQRLVKDLNALYRENKALYECDDQAKGFQWMNEISANECYVSFVRKGEEAEEMLLVVANFSGVPREITTGVPYEGKYKEILNTDAVCYGGTGVVNDRMKLAEDVEWDDKKQSVTVKLAPLSLSILQFIPYTEAELEKVIEKRIRKNTPIRKTTNKTAKKQQEKYDNMDLTDNVIEEVQQKEGMIASFLDTLPEKALNLGIRIGLALLFFFIGVQLIKLIRKIIRKSMNRAGAETGVIQFVDSFVKASLYIILILTLASSFGVDAASIVALLGSAGVAVGLAVQGSLSNLAGGVLILLLKPFKVGDYIVEGSSGKEGTVKEIQIFYTKLLTYDNQTIILPNGNLANNTIVNVTAAESRRCDVKVSVAYSADIRKAKEVLTKVLYEDPDTIKEREHFVFVDELADSGINLCVRCWFKNEDFWQGKWRITEQCKYALDKAEIEIPFPQMDVHMR